MTTFYGNRSASSRAIRSTGRVYGVLTLSDEMAIELLRTSCGLFWSTLTYTLYIQLVRIHALRGTP